MSKKIRKGILFGFLGGVVGFFLALFIFTPSCAVSLGVSWKQPEFLNPIAYEGAIIAIAILFMCVILGVKKGISVADGSEKVIVKEKKESSKSWFLAKINLIVSLLLAIPYLVVYLCVSFQTFKWVGSKGKDMLIISGTLTMFGFYLLIPIFVGIVMGIIDNFHKKKYSYAGFIINLLLALSWLGWLFIISMKGLQSLWTEPMDLYFYSYGAHKLFLYSSNFLFCY